MRLVLLACAIFLGVSSIALAADSILLTSRRGGWIEAIEFDKLETVARIRVPRLTESVASDPSGQRLFLAAPKGAEPDCCAFFALDSRSMRMSLLSEPPHSATVTSSNVFVNPGGVFDAQTLNRLPGVWASGSYRLQASPDGRLVAGITNWPQPSVDFFDPAHGAVIASHVMPHESNSAGTWLGEHYLLLTVQRGQATLRSIKPDRADTSETVSVPAPDFFADCEVPTYDAIALGTKIAIYGEFGHKLDGACPLPGGFLIVDPTTGAVTGRFGSTLHFRQMVANSDARYLYGLDVGTPAWQHVRIVKIDTTTGQVVAEKSLETDVWYLTSGQIPHEMRGRLDLAAIVPGLP